jgi:signal transduction histidine kinase
MGLALTRVKLRQLVQEVIDRMRPTIHASGSTVTLHAPDEIEGSWDRLRLDQIVANLLSNAIKYGRGRPIDIHVGREDGSARLRVIDQGIGIATSDHGRIFERFERAVSSKRYGGFGLGLWIVRQLVEALGGAIRVESEPGVGSSFIVDLPLQPASPSP